MRAARRPPDVLAVVPGHTNKVEAGLLRWARGAAVNCVARPIARRALRRAPDRQTMVCVPVRGANWTPHTNHGL
jgi:hypothetical protein